MQRFQAEYKVYLWNETLNNGAGGWEEFVSAGAMTNSYSTTFAKVTANLDRYVDGSGYAFARIRVRKTSPGITGSWYTDFEQGVWMYK
ncbi:MAG: hypothetical protein WAO58_11270 [Fimbriimonadaceae bacterium]